MKLPIAIHPRMLLQRMRSYHPRKRGYILAGLLLLIAGGVYAATPLPTGTIAIYTYDVSGGARQRLGSVRVQVNSVGSSYECPDQIKTTFPATSGALHGSATFRNCPAGSYLNRKYLKYTLVSVNREGYQLAPNSPYKVGANKSSSNAGSFAVRKKRVTKINIYLVREGVAGLSQSAISGGNSGTTSTVGGNIGVYMGPAKVAEHDQFSSWLGREVYYGLDFINETRSWNEMANDSNWLYDPWSQWVKGKSGRKMVISVPMLNHASAGQLSQGANGEFDQYFRTMAQHMVNKGLGNSVIRLGWEANGDWYPWKASTNPAAWKAYYRRIVGVMRSVPGQKFSFNLNYNLGSSGTSITFESIYPGGDVVDSLGIDAYDVKWQDTSSSPEVRWNNLLNQPMGLNDFKAFASSKGKPMSIPEWGIWPRGTQDGGYGDNPYYIDRMADWISANNSNIVFQSYFNHLSGWTGDHRLSSYPNSQAKYLERF